jgi:hypothetical protein
MGYKGERKVDAWEYEELLELNLTEFEPGGGTS